MVSDEQSDGHSRPQVCAPCTQTRHDFNHIAYQNLSPYQNQIYLSEDACHDNIHSPRSRPTNPESPQMPATQGTLCEHEPVKAMETNTKYSDWLWLLQCYNATIQLFTCKRFWKKCESSEKSENLSLLSRLCQCWVIQGQADPEVHFFGSVSSPGLGSPTFIRTQHWHKPYLWSAETTTEQL